MPQRYRVIGSNGSPYSMKLRAIMRYRRLPFDWVFRTEQVRAELAGKIKVGLIPVLHVADEDRYLIDSTPIAYELERRHSERSILPRRPGLAFLSHLIEDMADEWLTKAMFLYRWELPEDQDYGARWIIADQGPDREGAAFEEAVSAIRERQIGRMALVGCTAENAPVIKQSYWRIAEALNGFLRLDRYLFGSRPSLADFGLFGQLKTLATDPTPMTEMRQRTQLLQHWLRQADDLSGVEGSWIEDGADLPGAVRDLLSVAGEVYLPFLRANADAVGAGQDRFELSLLGKTYAQAPFGYQVKCLTWLREELAAISVEERASIEPLLRETGCWEHLTAG
ncbi:MAG: glutathione S-transferase N-terminal domain-containing protein [Pseudomonadota bacterium]